MTFQRKVTAAPSSGSKVSDYENLAEGEHEARLVYVADLGMQERVYQGEVKPDAQQIALCFEIIGKTVQVDGKTLPRIIWSKPFNIFGTMDSKSNEFALYKAFVPSVQENTIADWGSVLGSPVNVIIKHHIKDENTTYDNVASISSIPSKYHDGVGPAITNELSIAGCDDLDSPPIKALFGLAKFVHEKRVGATPSPIVKEAYVQAVGNIDEDELLSDEVPF